MTPRRTMSIAQQLYEGVDIEGEGTVGLITYMRTDSLRLSGRGHRRREGLHPRPLRRGLLPRQGPGLQDQIRRPGRPRGHPALQREPDPGGDQEVLTAEQYKLYKLIWSRFLACQMASAVYDSVSIEVTSAGYTFRATHSALKFSGYTAVYVEGKDEEEEAFQSPCPI